MCDSVTLLFHFLLENLLFPAALANKTSSVVSRHVQPNGSGKKSNPSPSFFFIIGIFCVT